MRCYCCGNYIDPRQKGVQGYFVEGIPICDKFCIILFECIFKGHLHKSKTLEQALLLRQFRHSICHKLRNEEIIKTLNTEIHQSKQLESKNSEQIQESDNEGCRKVFI